AGPGSRPEHRSVPARPCAVVQHCGASVFHYGSTPRNPVVGPGLKTFDLSVQKQFKMPYSDGQELQFRTEFFNAFNTPQFSNAGASLGTGTFGRITGTSSDNRQIQFGL